jgi:hypothetical protein
MKVYDLSCDVGHRFEGWFASEENFSSQSDQGLIACPICDSKLVTRLPAAPRLNLNARGGNLPAVQDDIQRVLLEAIRKLVAGTEDVGTRFAEEARRIHYHEAPQRGIRGIATTEEQEALAEEGIDVIALPIPEAFKQPLQ